MPPVATTPANRPDGQTARDAYMRPLQTRRKWAFGGAAGWGHPALRGNTNHCAVGAGHAPPAILRQREPRGQTAAFL